MDTNLTDVVKQKRYKTARASLLAIIIFSAINLFSIIFADSYFLFSSYFTQLVAFVGYELFVESGEMIFAVVSIIIGLITLVPYALCYFMSKKKVGWMIGALVLFSIDTAILLVDFVSMLLSGSFGGIIDLAFHIYALGTIVSCVVYGIKGKDVIEKEDIINDFDEPKKIREDYSEELASIERELVITKKKQAYGWALKSNLIIDGADKGVISNGEEKSIKLDGHSHTVAVVSGNGQYSETITLSSGYDSFKYIIEYKSHFVKGAIPVLSEDKQ